MKQQKICRLFSVLIACYLIASTVLPAFATETQTCFFTAQQPRTFASAEKVEDLIGNTEVTKQLRNIIKNAVIQCKSSVDITDFSIPFSQDLLNAFYTMTAYEIPEAFHVSNFSCSISGGTFTSLHFSYSCTVEEYEKLYGECEQAAAKLLDGIADNTSLSDVEKALLLHDRLALHCEYGNVYADNSETVTLYAALIGRKPVCQGYAVAYLHLLEQVGIKSEIVTSEKLNHAWNIVYIDNKPYHVDVTWDDPTADIYGRVLHNNFLLSTEALQAGVGDSSAHDADDFNTTPTDTTYDTYYWQNSETAFQLLGNEIYYIDHTAQELRKASDKSKVCSVESVWELSDDGYYMPGNHARLAYADGNLYCSMPTAVYTVNVSSGSMTSFYTPTMTVNGEQFYCIRGFACEDGTLYFNYCNMKDYYINTVKTSVSLIVTCSHFNVVYANGYPATCATQGKANDRICKDCGEILVEGSILPATEQHLWDGGTVTKSPTNKLEGVRTFTCTSCGATETQSIPKLENIPTVYGDIDNDGSISTADARLALRAAVGLETLEEDALDAADVDGDGSVTTADARLILRYSVGLESGFPQDEQ